MAKVRKFVYSSGDIQYLYNCPGCGYEHAFGLKSDRFADGHTGHHEFNMDFNNPTITPSLVQGQIPGRRCHSHIKSGKIKFLDDCDHHLAGQTVDLPEYDPERLTIQP